jgi:GTP-binding protein EngB required for normal cell division
MTQNKSKQIEKKSQKRLIIQLYFQSPNNIKKCISIIGKEQVKKDLSIEFHEFIHNGTFESFLAFGTKMKCLSY